MCVKGSHQPFLEVTSWILKEPQTKSNSAPVFINEVLLVHMGSICEPVFMSNCRNAKLWQKLYILQNMAPTEHIGLDSFVLDQTPRLCPASVNFDLPKSLQLSKVRCSESSPASTAAKRFANQLCNRIMAASGMPPIESWGSLTSSLCSSSGIFLVPWSPGKWGPPWQLAAPWWWNLPKTRPTLPWPWRRWVSLCAAPTKAQVHASQGRKKPFWHFLLCPCLLLRTEHPSGSTSSCSTAHTAFCSRKGERRGDCQLPVGHVLIP